MAELDNIALSTVFPDPPADIDLSQFDQACVPGHLAVIMDGNGRWARAQGISRAQGHVAGIKAVRELIRTSNDIGIRYLTIYSFSTENWTRPKAEVQALMQLFAQTMAAELAGLDEEGVRIQLIGDIGLLPRATKNVFESAVEQTAHNPGMTLVIAVNYGSRQEVVRAAQALAAKALAGEISPSELDGLTVERFAEQLDTAGMPDPDLVIRTSGEFRLSNFLLFQAAYSELFVTPVLWPDFDRYELLRALIAYKGRNRRFGSVG